MIQSRAIVQYFTPFSSVSLSRMAGAFGYSESKMDAEVLRLIEEGCLKARIDSRNKVK
jgi:COP9 signalosome complex subunit 1